MSRFRLMSVACLIAAIGAPAPAAAGADAAAPYCALVRQVLAEVRGFRPVGARAQLVMALAGQLDADPEKMRKAQDEIDQSTSAGCPREREALLAITKTTSLAEALR